MEDNKYIESIDIRSIDMDKCFFNPGCAFALYDMESAKDVLSFLNENYGSVQSHDICCAHNPNLQEGSVIISNCPGCDKRFRSRYDGVNTISLWELIDSLENIKLPSYNGLKVSIQDGCPFRNKPQVHRAVRSILSKMNIEIVESKFFGTKSICCGDNFYGKLPLEKVIELQKKRASQMPCDNVVVYCVSCLKSMSIGGKKPRHLVDLILGKETKNGKVDLDAYHKEISDYVKSH